MQIILASQSLFRGKALDILGLKYMKIPSNFDEARIRGKNPHVRTRRLSEAKAREVGNRYKNAVVVAGDLYVVLDQREYEKPRDLKEAARMLRDLSGKEHEIISGIAVFNSKTGKMLSASTTCVVRFRKLNNAEIKDYVSRYPVLRCAAAYESDGLLRFAENISGRYNFATGLPMPELIDFLREHGVKV